MILKDKGELRVKMEDREGLIVSIEDKRRTIKNKLALTNRE